nr:hypothetical protein [Tanacetum cinerariifolium]
MMEAVREEVQIQTDRLQDSFQRENDEFLRTIDENMKKIIKGQVKSQVKEQVSCILPRIKESVNATLEAEVLTKSSYSSRTSYAVAADLPEIELKKILIENMEGNKFIQRSDEQRNLYKALVDAYEADKTILESYGESAILKRRREDDDDREGPSVRSDRGSKRQREGREHASASTPSEQATGSAGRSTTGTQSRQMSASESAFAEEPVQTTCQMEEPSHPNKTLLAAQGNAQSWISELARQTDAHSSFNELLDTPIDFSNFIMNRLGVDTLTPKLLASPTYELMRGSCNSLTELEYYLEEVYQATTDQLDWVNPKGQQYPHNLLQPLPLIPDNRGRRVIPFEHFINNDLKYLRGVNRESALDVYSKRRIIAVIELKIMEWHNYKHLDWISLSNLTVEERFAFNVSLRMFTRSIVIQRRIEDLQLGVESYQKRLNLTKPDTYRSDLKRHEAYTAYSNPRGFIYQNKDKKNRLMRIDELHKFSKGTLNDVRNALDDRLKGIRMQYLSTIIWRRGDKDRAAAMIQAIDKMLKTRRIMKSLEKFVGRRLESTILKRRREEDDQEGPSAGSDRGSKRLREGGEHASASTPSETTTGSAGRSTTGSQSRQLSTSESAFAEEPMQTTCQIEEPPHPPRRPPLSDRDWNKTLPAAQGDAQSWISDLAKQTDARSSFNELLDTPINFSNFIMNQLNVDTLTPALLAGPTYELMRGSCTSLTELEYHLEEVYKATTDQLDWVNPAGQLYPYNLLQPLPLIPDNRGRRVIPFDHFINNDLEYLRGGTLSRKYTTSVTKTKEEDYGHIKWTEDLVPLNRESTLDVYSKRRIIAVTELQIMEWHNYKHLDWISVRRDDDKIYKFKEGNFKRLRLQDIEDMLLLLEHCHQEASGRSSTGS